MKRILGILGLFIIIISAFTPFAVKADVLWEPQKDFFGENNIPTTIERRYYIVNSPTGFINVYKSPDSAAITGQLMNGESFFVYYKAEYNGKHWGLNTSEEYICLENTYVKYDHISFAEEYSEKIEKLPSDTKVELKKGYMYSSYPGAAEQNTIAFDCPEAFPSYSFIDEAGLKWMFFGYVYGQRNFWVCMDEPLKRDHAIRTTTTVCQKYESATAPTNDQILQAAKEDTGTTLTVSKKGIYVVIACVCTFILALISGFLVLRKNSEGNK